MEVTLGVLDVEREVDQSHAGRTLSIFSTKLVDLVTLLVTEEGADIYWVRVSDLLENVTEN